MVQEGVQLPRVNQDTRLNNRVIDIRTLANQGIFRIQSQVGNVSFRFLGHGWIGKVNLELSSLEPKCIL